MKRVHILVEGQTEEAFVKTLLQSHFWSLNIDINPIIISTKRIQSGQKFKGGVSSYEKIKNELKTLLKDSSIVAVTTMFDYYGLPNDFPGYQTLPNQTCYKKVSYLMKEFKKDINNPRFYPFIILHEFEALLFVAPQEIANRFPSYNNIVNQQLNNIRLSFSSPEEINNGKETHPSARIKTLIETYDKVTDGIIIAQKIGLETIRSQCTHFNQWLEQLESL